MASEQAVREISPADLADVFERDEPVQVLDVRAPERLQSGRIDLGPAERFFNIRGSVMTARTSLDGTGLDPSVPVVVVCGLGRDSRTVARHLGSLGCDASSLAGGFAAWMRLAVPRALEPPPGVDHLVQFDRLGKGALGYLVVSDGQALVVDPPLDASACLASCAAHGADVVGVAETHVHADYVSGAARLAATLRVPHYLHPADSVYAYDGTPGRLRFHPIADRDTIRVGRCAVEVCHTPGHTEGSVTYLVNDDVALTGDFLFITSIGRPDLAGKTAEWTRQLWNSVERARREWAQGLRICPAHYGGEAERRADRTVWETFGHILQANQALRFTTRETFSAWVQSKTASFPEAYRTIKAINVGLVEVDDRQAEELEIGRNECALGGR